MQINALLGTESANGIPSQRSAAVAANGKVTDSSSLHDQLLFMKAAGDQDALLASLGALTVGWRVSYTYCTCNPVLPRLPGTIARKVATCAISWPRVQDRSVGWQVRADKHTTSIVGNQMLRNCCACMQASGWLRPETQAPAATAAATATAAAAVAVAAAAPTTTVRRRLFGRAQLCENLDCRAGSSKGWEVNGARSPPPAPRGYPQPWPKPPLDLGWPTLTLNDRELTPSVDSLDIPVSSPASPMGLEAEQQQQQQQPRAFAGWRKASLALAVAPEHDVYDTCRDETVRAVVSLKVRLSCTVGRG